MINISRPVIDQSGKTGDVLKRLGIDGSTFDLLDTNAAVLQGYPFCESLLAIPQRSAGNSRYVRQTGNKRVRCSGAQVQSFRKTINENKTDLQKYRRVCFLRYAD